MYPKCSLSDSNIFLQIVGLLSLVIIMIIAGFYYMRVCSNSIKEKYEETFTSETINTNTLQTLANYIQLNGNDSFYYQYGISFWIFIDSNPPNTNPNNNQYASLLNYGGKPNVLYKANTNTLMITMDQ